MMRSVKTLFTGNRDKNDQLSSQAEAEEEEVTLDDDRDSERPYIINSSYYLVIILLVGLPMWFCTCSSPRYALPDLRQLEDKLAAPGPRLHLDISVIQLASSRRDPDIEKQSEYLRKNLPPQLETSMQGLVYNLNWRIRRPTMEESQIMDTILTEHARAPATSQQRQTIYNQLETNLIKAHKAANRFRLFMYILDEPLSSLICTQPNSYLMNPELFVYLCPSGDSQSTANLITSALNEAYHDTVDANRIKKILRTKTDLLVSLIPESDAVSLASLSSVADKVHRIYDKNIKSQYLELSMISNIRLMTQNIHLIQDEALTKMLTKKTTAKPPQAQANLTQEQQVDISPRLLNSNEMGRLFHDYESRLNKHSSQSVQHVVTLVPDSSKPPLVLHNDDRAVHIMEGRDTNFILIGNDEKSLVLGMRAIVRRSIGLKSENLCKNCLIRRDVFLNKWELDAISGALTILKLQSVLVSLRSISQQAIGIKIPKYVSSMAHKAHALALESLDRLQTKQTFEAYHSVKSAYELSETAFYDPSLLETLYFPDETKYAIYLPLFLPLGFPLALSILRIIKYLLAGLLPQSSGRPKQKSS